MRGAGYSAHGYDFDDSTGAIIGCALEDALNATQSSAPNPLWSAALGQPSASAPLVAGDLLLVPTQEYGPSSWHATLHALSLVDGAQRWYRPFERALVSGLAALKISEVPETSQVLALVAITSTDLLRGEGMLVALDAAGRERWRWAPGVQRVSAPALVRSDDFGRSGKRAKVAATTLGRDQVDTARKERWRWSPGMQRVSALALVRSDDFGRSGKRAQVAATTLDAAVVTADARTLAVLDLATGVEQTRIALEAGASVSAPALVGDVAIVPCRGPHLLAVGLDGEACWRFTAGDGPDTWLDKTPVVVGAYIFGVLSTGAALALRVADGRLAWRVGVGPAGKPLSPPATDGELLFVGARDGLHALHLADGREVWAFSTPRRIPAAPAVAGEVVYATCHDHHLYALDAASGQKLWQHEVERRIKHSPALAACGEPSAPGVLVADRGGTVTAIARPLSAAEHAAAGHWVEAASAYASLGRAARGAELLETHGEPLQAAKLWEAAGERERAAVQYEVAGLWIEAARHWAPLGRPLKQAEALANHAWLLEDGPCSDEEKAKAWEDALHIFEAEGKRQRTGDCRQKVARWRKQPVISLDVQLDEGLLVEAWSRLRFIVRNEGFGPARNLIVHHATGDQFQGQVTATRRIKTLHKGCKRVDTLDVRPLQYGDSVPLRVSVGYTDWTGGLCSCEHTVYIPVARTEDVRREGQTISVFVSGSGAVAVGEGAVAAGAGGAAAGDRATVTSGSGSSMSPSLPATAHVLSFDKLSPVNFERLCLWLVELEGYTRAEHLGLAGSEQGRDVIAYKPTSHGEELWYFQCKRYGSIGARMLKDEVDKYLRLAEQKPHLRPTGVVFVLSCAASARVREEIGAYCKKHGLAPEFWALTELDMRVKRHPDLVREFFNLASWPQHPDTV